MILVLEGTGWKPSSLDSRVPGERAPLARSRSRGGLHSDQSARARPQPERGRLSRVGSVPFGLSRFRRRPQAGSRLSREARTLVTMWQSYIPRAGTHAVPSRRLRPSAPDRVWGGFAAQWPAPSPVARVHSISYQKHCQLPFRIPTRNDHLTMYTMHLTTALSTLHYTSMVHYLSLRPLSETFVFNTALQTFRKPAVQYSSTAPPEHAKTNPAARCRGNRVGVSSR